MRPPGWRAWSPTPARLRAIWSSGAQMNEITVFGIAVTWLAILVVGWLGWQLLRQNGRILLRLDDLEKRLNELEFGGADEPEGLPLGSDAPEFELPDLAGEPRKLAQYRGQPLLLIFFNPACGYCRDLAPKLAALAPCSSRRQEALTSITEPEPRVAESRSLVTSAATANGDSDMHPATVIISTGRPEENQQFFAQHKIVCPVLLQKGMEVAAAYQANGTPSGYL